MTPAHPLRWTSASRSHVGLVRVLNEDACLEQAEGGLWAVADGMGGHAHGDYASRLLVESLSGLDSRDSLAGGVAETRMLLQSVNQKLRAEAGLRHAQIIGSTVVVLLAVDGMCAWLWAGDSRLYLYRAGHLSQLTRDHSQVEELKSRVWLDSDDTLIPPSRNMLTRAVGATDTLDVAEGSLEVTDGDMFLLCSDGLSNELGEQEIRAALLPGDCRHAAERLVDMALERGGHDNVSVVVVRAEDPWSSDKTMANPAL